MPCPRAGDGGVIAEDARRLPAPSPRGRRRPDRRGKCGRRPAIEWESSPSPSRPVASSPDGANGLEQPPAGDDRGSPHRRRRLPPRSCENGSSTPPAVNGARRAYGSRAQTPTREAPDVIQFRCSTFTSGRNPTFVCRETEARPRGHRRGPGGLLVESLEEAKGYLPPVPQRRSRDKQLTT